METKTFPSNYSQLEYRLKPLVLLFRWNLQKLKHLGIWTGTPQRHDELEKCHMQEGAEKQVPRLLVHCAFYQMMTPWKSHTESLLQLLRSTELQDCFRSLAHCDGPSTYDRALHGWSPQHILLNKLLVSRHTIEFNTWLHITLSSTFHLFNKPAPSVSRHHYKVVKRCYM